VKFLLYFYLPSGLITFIIQIFDDFIVYEDDITDGLVMVRNMFELLPVIILIWVFKDKTQIRSLSKSDIQITELSIRNISESPYHEMADEPIPV
jgi:hypothetical protein